MSQKFNLIWIAEYPSKIEWKTEFNNFINSFGKRINIFASNIYLCIEYVVSIIKLGT